MDIETLTPDQFVLLREIGACAAPVRAIAFVHLGVLLRMDYIRAECDGYVLTALGLFRSASDF
jgi:hypothetical protein